MHADARIVDERINAAVRLDSHLNEAAALIRVSYVGWNGDGRGAESAAAFGGGFQAGGFPRGKDEAGPAARKLVSKLEPNSGRGSGDYDDVVPKFIHPRRK